MKRWGLGIGDWGLGPIPNPQSPNPQILIYFNKLHYYNNLFIINNYNNLFIIYNYNNLFIIYSKEKNIKFTYNIINIINHMKK